MSNQFKDPIMRGEYDAAMQMYRTKHRTLFYENGERRRSPNFGSSLATMFWRGFDGQTIGTGWDSESRKTAGYAHWRAGQDAAKAQQKNDNPVTPEQLFKYANRYARRSEAQGKRTLFPTFRKAAHRFGTTLDVIEDAIGGYTGPGYLGAIVGFKTMAGVGGYERKGDYQVEAYDD